MAQRKSEMKVCPQSTDNSTGNHDAPRVLIPIEAEGFHVFADAYALDGQWVIFLSIAGHKDAVKAIRATASYQSLDQCRNSRDLPASQGEVRHKR